MEDGVCTGNRWTMFQVGLSGVAHICEILVRPEHTSSKPDSIPLHQVLSHFAIHGVVSATDFVVSLHPLINDLLHLLLESLVESVEQGASSREHNVFVQLDSVFNGALLDRVIHNLTQGLDPVRVNKFLANEKR